MPDFHSLLAQLPSHEAATAFGVIGYRCFGARHSALPVVLLHGIGSGAASWAYQLHALGARRPVYAWDAPGYGASTAVASSKPAAEEYAQALTAWLEVMGISRCVLVGHSLGAIMAGAFAARCPERVAAMIFLSPAAGYAKADEQVRTEKRDNRLRMLQELGPQGLAEQRSGNMLSVAAGEDAKEWVRWNMARIRPAGYAQATHLLSNADLASDAAAYFGPLSIAVGAGDVITPTASCEKLADQLRRSEPSVDYHVFDGLGHACYIEAPDTLTAHIESFIQRQE